ncbi:MAG: DUF1207 domain-containing protein [Candidatus Cloacimonetes bacterium]|nr:DUF1207 domain-containing protein [Candidatus Cloacimonadota bacterium]
MSTYAARCLLPVVAAILACLPAAAHAQAGDWLLPRTRNFRHPIADPLAPRFGLGILTTDLLRARGPERGPFMLTDSVDAASDVQATAALGGTLPVALLGEWNGGSAVLAVEAAAFARFRIEYPSRDDLGTDWFISLPVEIRHGDWAGRIAIMHRSSHLGDEFMIASGAERIEFGHEAIELTAARMLGNTRVYGGGAWVFRSNTAYEMRTRGLGEHDRAELEVGAEHVWRFGAVGEAFAGVDVQAAERTDWRASVALAGGAGLTYGGRSIRLVVRYHDGVSRLGEFFLTDERFLGLDLVIIP